MSGEASPGESLVRRLRALDVCAVSDALDHFDLPGVASVLASVSLPGKLCGRVVAVELGPPRGSASTTHLCTEAVAASGSDDVIVVDHQGRDDCAGWGGNLSRAASRRGIGGTIVFGAVRDVDESRELRYPVFATGVTPRTARGRTVEQAWGHEIQIDGITVRSGDLVIGDGSGVAFVPEAEAPRVIARAEEIAEREAEMADAIERGTPVTAVMGAKYERMIGESSD